MESDTYLTIKSFSHGEYKEKGSRFMAFAYPVNSIEEIKPIIEALRKEHHDARHHCYAYLLGPDRLTYRVNDDGEPSGTAGKPILGQINSRELTNILIVVVRYFGGRLLGVSGLINAYRSAAEDALSNAIIARLTIRDYYRISFPFSSLNSVMKLIKEEEISATDHNYDTTCTIALNFRISARERILNRLSRIEGLEAGFVARR